MDKSIGVLVIIVFGLIAIFFLWRRAKKRLVERQDQAVTDAFPDCIDLFSAALRAGYSPAQGISFLGQHAPQILRLHFIAATRRIDEGERFSEAIRRLHSEIGPVSQPMCEVLIAGD